MIRERIVARIQAKHPNLHAKFQVTVEEWAEKGYELESWQFNSIDTGESYYETVLAVFVKSEHGLKGSGVLDLDAAVDDPI